MKNLRYLVFLTVTLPLQLEAITFYPPFCDSPCQTTYGPGSYGKSCSEVRYRDGWRWKSESDNHSPASRRCARKKAYSSGDRCCQQRNKW